MANRPDIEQLIIPAGETLKSALQVMDANAQGIVFVVNADKKPEGVLTDGDVRRYLLGDGDLNEKVDSVMTRSFTVLPADAAIEQIQRTLSDRIKHIPLVDPTGVITDYASHGRLRRIPVMEPSLAGNELNYITQCVQTNWISSQGKFVTTFEDMLAEYCGVPHALAVSNGTVALHLAMVALGIGEGDEVIVPNLTFAASVNAVLYCGATPVLVDCAADSWNLDTEQLESLITPRTKAIMPVHLYGHPCDMGRIQEIARKHDLLVVEDAAEALGSEWKGERIGSFGDVATFSFFGNKTITTGEGGMILFQDKAAYEHAKVLRDHGMSKTQRYWHEHVGFNYRMTNMQAAIGVAQMERVDEIVASKIKVGNTYNNALKDIEQLTLPPVCKNGVDTFWLYTLRLADPTERDGLITKLQANGIETRPVFYPLSDMPPYQAFATRDYPNSERVSAAGISLPSSVTLDERAQLEVADALRAIFATKALLKNAN